MVCTRLMNEKIPAETLIKEIIIIIIIIIIILITIRDEIFARRIGQNFMYISFIYDSVTSLKILIFSKVELRCFVND